MKELLRTTLTLAALAASIPCQLQKASPKEQLDYATVVERSEGRLDRAEQLYRGLLADEQAAAVHDDAAYRLGSLLCTLGKRDEATPFLQRAAKAGGALAQKANALLQQGAQGAEQDKDREKKAEALVARMNETLMRYADGQPMQQRDRDRVQALETELRWLGAPAARVVVRQLAVDDATQRSESKLRNQSLKLSRYYQLLWSLGTDPARIWLRNVAESAPLPLQRFATDNAKIIGDGMVDVVAAFARCEDPTGEVWRNLVKVANRLDVQAALELTGRPGAATKALGVQAAARNWSRYALAEREAYFSMHHKAVEDLLASDVARQREPAIELLQNMVARGPKAGTELFLQIAHTLPKKIVFSSGPQSSPSEQRFVLDGDDGWIATATAAARRLGPVTIRQQSASHDAGASGGVILLLRDMQHAWTDAAIDDLITLLELGYIRDQERWLQTLYQKAGPAQMARVIRAMPKQRQPQQIFQALKAAPGHPSWFDAYQEVVDRCFEDPSIPWRGNTNGGVVYWRGEVSELVRLAVVADPTRSAPWVTGIAHERVQLRDGCIELLLMLSRDNVAGSRAALREMIVRHAAELEGPTLESILTELVRAGDALSIPLLAQNYGTGWTDGTNQPSVSRTRPGSARSPNRGVRSRSNSRRRIDYLLTGEVGYSFQQQLQLWQALVTGPHVDKVWSDLCTKRSRTVRMPLAGLPALSYLIAKEEDEGLQTHRAAISNLLAAFGRLEAEQLEKHSELRASLDQLMLSPEPWIALTTFGYLPKPIAAKYREHARKILDAHPRAGSLERLAQRLAFDDDRWRQLLAQNTYAALRALPDDRVADFEDEIVAHVRSSEQAYRKEAAATLIRGLGSRAAPFLLPLLRDDDQYVRKYAKQQLDELRAIRQQEDFWGDASKRIDTTPASAAAKLIAQAMPGQDKAQRLLAIRSLALLGEPTSLPYLIDWTSDDDQEVQKAARAAITEMHGAGKGAGKAKK